MNLLKRKSLKTIAAFGTMVFFMSCTNDVVTTTGGLINNNNFVKDTINLEPVLSTVNIDTVRTNLLSTYLLGEYTDAKLGNLKASIVGQLAPSLYPLKRTTAETPGEVTTSDVEVTLELPLTLVNKEDSTIEFDVANFVGDVNSSIDVTVSTFTTYLEQLNANGASRVYYSNGTNDAASKEDLGTETVLGSRENIFLGVSYTEADTLKITLDNTYFESKLNELDALDISNSEDFRLFFKGLKVTATKDGLGYAVPFNLSLARLRIMYKNTDALNTETNEELTFKFQGVVYDLYEHDHANSNEADKVYVQGAGGYETSVDISSFITANSVASQSENWLINQAKLKIYVDEINDQTLQSFYLYGIKSDGTLAVVNDYITLGVGDVNGVVGYEDIENEEHPYILFYITDFIKAALAEGEVAELRIKARETTENTSINLSSSIPKGALLLSNDTDNTDNIDKTPNLEVIYSKIE
ncbi:hypothetical protein AXE80_12575 [Wenyingzhuangia fucanilytica]|uniref:DUF4270 domain-containing protein n=1 Tax=Wenyingzhuangia fucanilytica TaxID=1790137 RepID=A0A1B1Y8M0_9FLAO|nr:DUF4270 family protein [Wenyingzhuangia fucanilytica]ANW97069.1 hypothetical protein AXE80_12575 [Wenyingzhuangia fucanilytica]